MNMHRDSKGIDQILNDIGELRGIVSKGFEGTNRRLDYLNGKVADHEHRMQILQSAHEHHLEWADKQASQLEQQEERQQKRKEWWSKFWVERVIWIILLLAGWVLLATGIITVPV